VPVVEARATDLTVPPPPEPPYNEEWGASEDGELDEIASVLKLTPEQRAQTREFIITAQNDFIKALAEAGAAGEKDITIIERIGEQFSRRTKEQIRGILKPEQYAAFDDLMRQKEEMR
jgi:Spy/CpxP family protein refolding chaperone